MELKLEEVIYKGPNLKRSPAELLEDIGILISDF